MASCNYESEWQECEEGGEVSLDDVLRAVATGVPIHLMKRDLLFIAEQMLLLLDGKLAEIVIRNRGNFLNQSGVFLTNANRVSKTLGGEAQLAVAQRSPSGGNQQATPESGYDMGFTRH